MPQRIGPGGNTQVLIVDMRIDLCGIEIGMSQQFLKCTHINAVLQHERGSRVPQLMRGILSTVQSCGLQMVLDQHVDRTAADALIEAGEKQCFLTGDIAADSQIVINGRNAGVIQIDNTFFVTLAEDADVIDADVSQI